MKWLKLVIIFLFMMVSSSVYAFPYVVNDFNFYPAPDTPNPEWGVPYTDPIFGTEIVRITDAELYITSGYPKWSIENCDGTKLLIYKRYIYDANTFTVIHTLPRNCWDTKDPDQHWSADDPNVLYITYSEQFLRYNVETGERTVLFDFLQVPEFADIAPTISRVYTMEEGDASDDRRYWALLVRCYDANHVPTWYNSHLLMLDKDYYGKDQPKIISLISREDPNYLGAGMISSSPSGNYAVVGAPPVFVYSRDLQFIRRIETHGHFDLAVDDTGREVVVWVAKYGGPDGYSSNEYRYWVKMADIETGEEFWLAPFGYAAVFHVSGNSHKKPGWAVINSYLNETPEQWESANIIMYELTRRLPARPDWTNHGKVWRVAHSHMKRERYADDPFAKLNIDGTKIWFVSGWGKSYNDGGPLNVYQINLPSTWYEDLGSMIPPPPPPPPSPTITSLTAKWTQDLPDPNDLEGWTLWYSADQTDWVQLAAIPFESEQVEYSHVFDFPQIEGVWHFRMRAYDEVPNFSGWSNVAPIDLTEPEPEEDVIPPSDPSGLTIEKVLK